MAEAPSPAAAEIHWADAVAAKVAGSRDRHHVSTGISPSGEIHVGNLREVLTGEILARAIKDAGRPVSLHYFADDFDPLRRVYPFLDPAVYGDHLGRPLSAIPCPCGRHPSYADHFLEPFLRSLPRLGIQLEVYRSSEVYLSGRMVPLIVAALRGRDRIAAILQDLTGKRVEQDWSPFQAVCPACGRMTKTRVTGFSEADATVDCRCECGARSTVAMAGGGKLQWRVDWPARWKLLEVTVEPFGKDHASEGGSYDTGVRIVREVFDSEPPEGVPFEWISLPGRGDMSSSRGNVVGAAEVLEAVPAEVIRFLIARQRPMKTITFDPGLPLLALVDEYEALEAKGGSSRLLRMCRVGEEFRRVGVPFRHLVHVIQMAAGDRARAEPILRRGGYRVDDPAALAERLGQARAWVERFAPESEKFSLRADLPPEAAALSAEQRDFLRRLAGRLEAGRDAEEIHQTIYEEKDAAGLPGPQAAFQAIYLALLGKRSGPRAGWFLALLDPDFVRRRLREAAGAAAGGSA